MITSDYRWNIPQVFLLSTLLLVSAGSFMVKPVQADAREYDSINTLTASSSTMPTSISPGQQFDFTMTLKNTSNQWVLNEIYASEIGEGIVGRIDKCTYYECDYLPYLNVEILTSGYSLYEESEDGLYIISDSPVSLGHNESIEFSLRFSFHNNAQIGLTSTLEVVGLLVAGPGENEGTQIAYYNSEDVLITAAGDTWSQVPLYRFYSSRLGSHFYTASQSQRDNVMTNPLYSTWAYEGIAYKVVSASTCTNGAKPVYRFFSPQYGRHFYTINQNQYNTLVNDIRFNKTWLYEGIAFCAFEYEAPGTQAVYRFFNDSTVSHFYIMGSAGYNAMFYRADLRESWDYEGVAYYAFPN